MQTQLADFIKNTPEGKEADSILRSCVHCGFCTATCPTYQLLGDEDDGPRGRIYLIKSLLEGNPATAKTQRHLDRCLSCRSCETTCPSGVNYHRLLDIGRAEVEKRVKRPAFQRLLRWLLITIMPRRPIFSPLLKIGMLFRPLLPALLKEKVPKKVAIRKTEVIVSSASCVRKVIMLEGCVQPAMAPNINASSVRVLRAIGIDVESTPSAGCCGALRFHLNAQDAAKDDMRNNVDAWWPVLNDQSSRVEAIVINASGCAPQVKSYGELLAEDAVYASKAQQVSVQTLDISEFLIKEEAALTDKLSNGQSLIAGLKVAFHSPCTLQHGQKIIGVVERLLAAAGCELIPVADSHLCCGSAGTYSILEPTLSKQLRDNKLKALTHNQPDIIATANIGCYSHMQPVANVPVKHWIELLDEALNA